MKNGMPILRYIISMLLLFVCNILISESLSYPINLLPSILYAVFSYGTISVAYSRKVENRNTVAWLVCLWPIPFTLLIASIVAVFGKTENDSKASPRNKRTAVLSSNKFARTKKISVPAISANRGVDRLCLVVGVLLAGISFIEINGRSGIGKIVCGGHRKCFLFGKPNVATVIIVFVALFVIAKMIKFIMDKFVGPKYRKHKDNREKYRKYLRDCDKRGKTSLSYKRWKFAYANKKETK